LPQTKKNKPSKNKQITFSAQKPTFMSASTKNNSTLVTALIFLGIGVFWFLKKWGVIFPDWLFSWPMILVLVGLFIGIGDGFKNPASYILVALGALFLIEPYINLPRRLYEFLWPAILIAIGLVILINYFRNRNNPSEAVKKKVVFDAKGNQVTSDTLNISTIMSETTRLVESKTFTGGTITNIMGSTKIHLGRAGFNQQAVLSTTVLMGEVKIIVPADCEVVVETNTIMGAVNDKRAHRPSTIDANKRLVLTGTVIMGEIKLETDFASL
jgi:predicted membrane protein